MRTKTTIAASVPKELKRWLVAHAKQTKRIPSHIVQDALEAYRDTQAAKDTADRLITLGTVFEIDHQ